MHKTYMTVVDTTNMDDQGYFLNSVNPEYPTKFASNRYYTEMIVESKRKCPSRL